MDLRLVRSESGQDSPETQRVFAKRRAHPVVPRGRRVAFIKNEVDHFQHGRQTGGKIGPSGNLKGDARLAEGPLGPDDALCDSRRRHEEGTSNLVGCQSPEQTKRKRNARFRGEDRMARDEHETKEVIADVIVLRDFEIRHGRLLLRLELTT